ncbi:hypothetical protein HanXRQr2_Chr05g0212101 [Helianthus annuus]|uniref:Uncharacterized protein n=1 Tax=Helianthus annuus TaxID=4232 RepID=A0A9K3IZL2_HELAN|nr:hypothetical protein HanXRQr2_Chr05g0212101 [Helianthus annuus]
MNHSGNPRTHHHCEHNVLCLKESNKALEESICEKTREHEPSIELGLLSYVRGLTHCFKDRTSIHPDDC